MPGSVTSIGDSAFDGCRCLTAIEVPDSVTTIGYHAFEDCSGLQEIHSRIEDISAFTSDDIFDGVDKENCKVYVPIGCDTAYRHHPAFRGFRQILTEE